MTEPEKKSALEEQTSEEAELETATPEETRAKEGREFDSALYRLVAITGLISFYGPLLLLFFVGPLFVWLESVAPSAYAELFERILTLLFFAIPISAIVGLFSCLSLWLAPTTKADLKIGIVFSALADVFALGLYALLPGLNLFS